MLKTLKNNAKFAKIGTTGSAGITAELKAALNSLSIADAQEAGLIEIVKFQKKTGDDWARLQMVTNHGNINFSSKVDMDEFAELVKEGALGSCNFVLGQSKVEDGFTGNEYFHVQVPNGWRTNTEDITVPGLEDDSIPA